jgi:predicted dehydrogenase
LHASGLVVGKEGNAELVAGCDLSEPLLAEFEERFGQTWPRLATYTDHRKMLAEAELDIVTVATSDHRHADLVVDAAEAGVKGIFCEKPLATNLADADRMLEAVERNNVILSVDHTRRWQPLWRHTREVVAKGEIGEVQHIVGTLTGSRAMLVRNGTHLIDAICYFAAGEPEWVTAELEEGYEDYSEYRGDGGHEPASEPGANGYIRFDNGVRALYVGGSKTAAGARMSVEIEGTTGTIRIDGERSEIHRKGEAVVSIDPPSWEVEGIAAGVRELVRLVDEGGEPVSSGRDGLRVVEVLIGFLESQQRDNAKVRLPLPR